MEIEFHKYQGTGNDFIMIDNRADFFPKENTSLVAALCDRRFGIGGDGLILLESDNQADFKMVYYNSDGNTSSMCGNGGRCIVAFAKKLGLIDSSANFIASDGMHDATIAGEIISLHMKDVDHIKTGNGYIFLDTGSPHHVEFVEDVRQVNVTQLGAKIRYGDLYGSAGSNVNFVDEANGSFSVRTYERGVEDETLSCGTGVTAVAIAVHYLGKTKSETVKMNVEGGTLEVSFSESGGKYSKVYLKGENIYLRALEPEDLEFLHSIENDENIWEVSNTQTPYSKFLIKRYLENAQQDIYEAKQLRLAICRNKEFRAVGLIDLFDFDPRNRRAGIGIMIKDKDQRGKGVGSEALALLIGYSFHQLNLHQIYANIDTGNEASISLFTKFGFNKIGTKKDWNIAGGKFKDESLFQLINHQ
ncbi:MAG: diaminopimelate epimerase [Flavobacterium sp.]|nr:MAG: diaminopimelate epimerase [Flavobacterium sp.]